MQQFFLQGGDAGIRQTVGMMESITAGPQGVGSSLVKSAAMDAVNGTIRDITEIQGIFDWVKQNIQFRDEAEETLQSPEATLRLGGGDCDDHAMLEAAIAGSLGYNWGFKTVAVARDNPEHFSHVYAVVQDKRTGNWVPMDSTVKNSYAGWEPDDITRSQMYRHRQMGRIGRLGDSQGEIAIPDPADTGDLTGTAAVAYNLAAPFAQAGAALLQNSGQPQVNLNAYLPWILILGAVGLVVVAMK